MLCVIFCSCFCFEYIFSDIFSGRSAIYKNIISKLVTGPLITDDIAKKVGLTRTGTFDGYLTDLVLSGFITRDYTWHLKTGKISKLSRYRLKDNYLRFYLKYILPNQAKIEKNQYQDVALTLFPGWETIMGLQFENLVVNNHAAIMRSLGIQPEEVLADNPFFQPPTTRQPGCQIDYLIQTRFDTLYVCEIKFSRNPIGTQIITDMQEKINRLKAPKHLSRRAVLIHVNGVTDDLLEMQYFSKIIDFGQLLDQNQ